MDPVSFVAHLLPTIAHLMGGQKTEVSIHSTWVEYPILYNVLVASKSSSKSPVMHLITKEVSSIAKEERDTAYEQFKEREEEQDDDVKSRIFNNLAYVRVFDAATAQGIQHTLASGSGNILGCVDEMADWPGLTDILLQSNLLKSFSALPWNDLTVKHQAIVVEKPMINLVCNIQTPIIVELLKKNDAQGKWSRYSLWAARPDYGKRFNLDDQLKPLDPALDNFDLNEVFKRIAEFHDSSKVKYKFGSNADAVVKEYIKQLNAMSEASEDEDFKSLIAKCVAKLIRTCMVLCALRKAVDEDSSEINMRNGIITVLIRPEDVERARRCTLYTIASFVALKSVEEDHNEDYQVDSISEDQPTLPRARKYRRKIEAIPDIETSTTADLTTPKMSKILMKWYQASDENDEVSLSKILHNRWIIRNSSCVDADQLTKLVELFSHHGIISTMENPSPAIKFIRQSNSNLVSAKIEILKEEIAGFLC